MLSLRTILFVYVVISILLTISCVGKKLDSSAQQSVLKGANLKSYYNTLFNAEQLMLEQEGVLSDLKNLDVEKAVSVFPESSDTASDPIMDAVINKVYKVLLQDSSHDFYNISYYLIARAYYYKGELYKANAYFDLLLENNQQKLDFEAYVWKSRAFLQLGHYQKARTSIDSAQSLVLDTDKNKDQYYAAEANYHLQIRDTSKAISFMKEALKYQKNKNLQYRWYWLLANWYDEKNNQEEAIHYYKKVKNSNAPYSLALTSEVRLKQISIREQNLDKNELQHAFKKILEDPKNASHKDFIIAQMNKPLFHRSNKKELFKSNTILALSSVASDTINQNMINDLNDRYNQLFQFYQDGKYQDVIKQSNGILSLSNKSDIHVYPQIHYLKALAMGRSLSFYDFIAEMKEIPTLYPKDEIITPLVKEQLIYLHQHADFFIKQKYPLDNVSKDLTLFSEHFGATPWPQLNLQTEDKNGMPIAIKEENEKHNNQLVTNTQNSKLVTPQGEYYLVVNVNDSKVNLSPSRYGIGQFNRTRFKQLDINHRLLSVNNENQLILIGVFQEFEEVKDYELIFLSLLDKIMKVPQKKYNTFVVRKEDVSSLKDRAAIEEYYKTYIKRN